MKTTLDLPDDLMREVETRAANQGRELEDVMAETLRSGLFPDAHNQSQPRVVISKDPELGHPVVYSSPDAPITRMTIEEILKLEQDALYQEDMQRVGISV